MCAVVVNGSTIGQDVHPRTHAVDSAVNAKILATTYFPERLPSQYLRRWRA